MNNMLLFHKLSFINHAIMKRNANEKDISKGQGRLLVLLNKKDGFSTKELSEILNIKVTSVNETLNKLQENGYVEKRPSPNDKRVLLVYLTDKGREFELKPPKDLDIFDCLSDEEKEEFDKYLTMISQEIHEKIKAENPEKYEKMVEYRQKMMKKYFGDVEEMFRL